MGYPGRALAGSRHSCIARRSIVETQVYSFTYYRPKSARQAANLLAKTPNAKLLAGGHSLIPVMKLRLAQPSALIDLNGIAGLAGVELKRQSIVVGAMTRHF